MGFHPANEHVVSLNESEEALENARILVVDDDYVYVHLCRRYLKSDPVKHYQVESAGSIEDALYFIKQNTYNCLIVDYCLPDGNGTDAIVKFAEVLGEDMPCTIVLTGQASEQVAINAVRSGASDFLTKRSLTKSALCRAVNNATEKSRLRHLHNSRLKDLEVANNLLMTRNSEIQRFYHTVSHEVKTPLTAIQEFVSLVHDGIVGEVCEQQQTILNYALESCDQIRSQFDELLELSRFETGKMQITMEPSSLYHVFDHCIAAAQATAREKGIELLVDDEQQLPLVMMQSNRIIQVISNLIGNAIKFTPEGGTVIVAASTTSGDEGTIRLSVKDTGCGISDKDVQHIFERLYQVTPSSEQMDETGMGLGLSIASQIIDLHGGRIEVQSTLGVGSEFSFELGTCEMLDRDTPQMQFQRAA